MFNLLEQQKRFSKRTKQFLRSIFAIIPSLPTFIGRIPTVRDVQMHSRLTDHCGFYWIVSALEILSLLGLEKFSILQPIFNIIRAFLSNLLLFCFVLAATKARTFFIAVNSRSISEGAIDRARALFDDCIAMSAMDTRHTHLYLDRSLRIARHVLHVTMLQKELSLGLVTSDVLLAPSFLQNVWKVIDMAWTLRRLSILDIGLSQNHKRRSRS